MIGNVLSSLVGDLIHLLRSPRHQLHFNKEFNLNLAMDSIFPTHTRSQYSGTCFDANKYSGGCMHTAPYSGTKIGLYLVSSKRSSCSYDVPQQIWHQNPLFEIFSPCHSQGHNSRSKSLPHAQCNSGQLMQCTCISGNKPTNATIRQTMPLKYKLWHYIQAEKPFVNVHRLSCSNTTAHGTTHCISEVAVWQLHCKNCTVTIALYVAPDVALKVYSTKFVLQTHNQAYVTIQCTQGLWTC